MKERSFDRRNRKWRSLQDPAVLHVRVSQRTKAILSALREGEVEQVGYGQVIEKLAEQHANILEQPKNSIATTTAAPENNAEQNCGS